MKKQSIKEGWEPIKLPLRMRLWNWLRRRKHSYSISMTKGLRVTAGERYKLDRATPFKDGTYKFVKGVGNRGELIISDGKTDEVIGFTTTPRRKESR